MDLFIYEYKVLIILYLQYIIMCIILVHKLMFFNSGFELLALKSEEYSDWNVLLLNETSVVDVLRRHLIPCMVLTMHDQWEILYIQMSFNSLKAYDACRR